MNLKFIVTPLMGALVSVGLAQVPLNGSFEVNSAADNGVNYWGDTADHWFTFYDLFYYPTPDMWDNNGSGGNLPGDSNCMTGVSAFDGTKFAALGSYPGSPVLPGFMEAIQSSGVNFVAGTTYTLSLALLQDSTNGFGYAQAAPLTVRLRSFPGNGPGFIVGAMAANTVGKTWEMRSLQFQVATSGIYDIILSNESESPSYLGIDSVNLVPEPSSMAILGIGALALSRRRRK